MLPKQSGISFFWFCPTVPSENACTSNYYIKTNEDSGHIKFFDPKEVKTMYSPTLGELNDLSTNIVRIKPEEGKLLLFPSYLHHAVEENISDEDRIVISFNLDIK